MDTDSVRELSEKLQASERMVRELQGSLGELTRENARLKSSLRDLVVLVEWLGNTGSRGAKDALSEVQA